jgi:type II secretory pathway component PulJ
MRGERGEMSLAGLLVAMSLFIVVLGATIQLFQTSTQVSRDAQIRADQQDRARVAVDALTKQLRNLASPTPDQPDAVDRATARDLIFKTVDPVGPNSGTNFANVKRLRYCLDGSRQLWRQQQRWTGPTPAAPPATGCPGTGWNTSDVVVADSVVNDDTGEPIFRFNSTTLSAITRIRVALLVDLERGKGPEPTELSSGVFLRNQNRAPTASFTPTVGATEIVLNGSASSDPEGDPLTYVWKNGSTEIGRGIVLKWEPAKGTYPITLQVLDPAGLTATAGPTTVTL